MSGFLDDYSESLEQFESFRADDQDVHQHITSGEHDPVDGDSNVADAEQDDLLGLDTQIKLTKRKPTARVDNNRIFSQKGLGYLLKNHHKLLKTIQRNDKQFEEKSKNGRVHRAQKFQHEYDNLSSVLQFYQLWCHGMFPKANFKDCVHLLRLLGAKSPRLRLYRRELIEQEIIKLKEASGIIVEQEERENTLQAGNIIVDAENQETEDIIEASNINNVVSTETSGETNGLFVGDNDDDDLYHTPPPPETVSPNIAVLSIVVSKPDLADITGVSDTDTTIVDKSEVNIQPIAIPVLTQVSDLTNTTNNESDHDAFSDDDDFYALLNETFVHQERPPQESDYDAEEEVMKEMGL